MAILSSLALLTRRAMAVVHVVLVETREVIVQVSIPFAFARVRGELIDLLQLLRIVDDAQKRIITLHG